MSQGLCPSCGTAVSLTAIRRFMLCLLIAVVASCGKAPQEVEQDNPTRSQGNDTSADSSNGAAQTTVAPAAEPALPQEISISREAFEARHGKPLFTQKEFEAIFKNLYGLGLEQFFDMLGTNYFGVKSEHSAVLADAVRLFGNKSDSLIEAYSAVVPRVFVSQVQPGSIAEFLGLKSGDEVIDAYQEIYRDGWQEINERLHDTPFGSCKTNGLALLRFPLASWLPSMLELREVLKDEASRLIRELRKGQTQDSVKPKSAVCVVTSRGILRQTYLDIVVHLLRSETFGKIDMKFRADELQERFLNVIRKANQGHYTIGDERNPYTQIYDLLQEVERLEERMALITDILPVARNWGAVLETRFEKRSGLDPDAYRKSVTQVLRTICPKRPYDDEKIQVGKLAYVLEHQDVQDSRYYDCNLFANAEPFDGFGWDAIHREMLSIKPVPSFKAGSYGDSGFLGQIWYLRQLVHSLDFAVYRSDGVDSLVLYNKEGVALCLQTLWGSERGFIKQYVPSRIDLPRLLEPDAYNLIREWNSERSKRLALDFLPVQGVWSPLLGGQFLLMPNVAAIESNGGAFQVDRVVNIRSNPKAEQLLVQQYVSYFTNTFVFFNTEAPVAIQNNGMAGGPESQGSEERLAPGIVDWPGLAAFQEYDRGGNLVFAGKNYTGQLMLRQFRDGYRRGRLQVFGRTSIVLPLLTQRTLDVQGTKAAEKAYWNRYREMMTGRSGQPTPGELLEEANRRQILRQLLQGK